MASDPAAFFENSITRMQSIPFRDLSRLQLEAAMFRFDSLRDRIPILKKLADSIGVSHIADIDDLVPLMFDHNIYKSYPVALLNDCRFDQLTRWLDKLTAHDLSTVDVTGLGSIDDWLEKMDAETPLMVCHSSGTTGTMSFLPIDRAEWSTFTKTYWPAFFQRFGDDFQEHETDGLHVIYPYFRSGRSTHLRINDFLAEAIARSEDKFHAAYPGRMSSDVLYLAGRLHAAKAQGNLHSLALSPSLLQRKAEFEAIQKSMPARMDAFFRTILDTLQGKRVFLQGTWNVLLGLADIGLERNVAGFFAENSVLVSGGGGKGMVMPDDWKERVLRFTGASGIHMVYSMSETPSQNLLCDYGHYHLAPWIIPFVLDPQTGDPLPREGTVTGRAAFFDLIATSHWGGFISGDEVTINWDCDCPCGRTSPYLMSNIERYSEKTGGDDKITCAATAEAHEEALEFLVELEL